MEISIQAVSPLSSLGASARRQALPRQPLARQLRQRTVGCNQADGQCGERISPALEIFFNVMV